MKARIIAIGNSRGVRIPKHLLEQTKLEGEVELSIEGRGLLIRPSRTPRAGWSQAFQQMARKGDDVLVNGSGSDRTAFDENEWEW